MRRQRQNISKEPEERLNHYPLRLKMKTMLVQQQKYSYFTTSDKMNRIAFVNCAWKTKDAKGNRKHSQ